MKRQLVFGILAAVILSATPAIASDHEPVDAHERGIRIGPLGQCFACGLRHYRGYRGFAFVPSYRHYRLHRYYRGLY
jgi:hypothetical protein